MDSLKRRRRQSAVADKQYSTWHDKYAGIDRFFLVCSPVLFGIFNLIYWGYFYIWNAFFKHDDGEEYFWRDISFLSATLHYLTPRNNNKNSIYKNVSCRLNFVMTHAFEESWKKQTKLSSQSINNTELSLLFGNSFYPRQHFDLCKICSYIM